MEAAEVKSTSQAEGACRVGGLTPGPGGTTYRINPLNGTCCGVGGEEGPGRHTTRDAETCWCCGPGAERPAGSRGTTGAVTLNPPGGDWPGLFTDG